MLCLRDKCLALWSGLTITLVNASIFMNDDVRAKWVPIYCCFLPISIWHFHYGATTTYDRDFILTEDIVHGKMVSVHCCFSVICS